jgi:hypothetical protein
MKKPAKPPIYTETKGCINGIVTTGSLTCHTQHIGEAENDIPFQLHFGIVVDAPL